MFIACIVVVALLLLVVTTVFFMTYKKYTFQIEGGQLKVQTIGNHLKIYFNDSLIKDVFSPQLFKGEKIDFNIKDKQYNILCKCNTIGNKLQIKLFQNQTELASNGIEIDKREK